MSAEPGRSSAGWDDLARRAAAGAGKAAESDALRQLLCLDVAGAPYALAVASVREIVRIGPITPIPRVSTHVRGVISLRGEILEVIDLRQRLGLPPAEIGKDSRIVVVDEGAETVAGLLVDGVREVLRVSEASIGPPAGDASGLVSGLCLRGEAFVSLLDLGRVLEVGDA